jgi:hypothetical protein
MTNEHACGTYALKGNGIVTNVVTWVNLEDIYAEKNKPAMKDK